MRAVVKSRTLALCAVLLAAGCADSPAGGKLRDDVPDPPAGGVQLVTPTFTVSAGQEVFMCMRVPFEVTEDWYVQKSNVYQMANGHHTLLFYRNNSAGIEPAPHPCDGLDMTDLRFVTTGTGNGRGMSMPPGVVLKVPQGAAIWAQSHYINASDQERLVQDVINLELVPAAEAKQIASLFAHVDLTFSLPVAKETTRTMSCAIPFDMTVPWMVPHMHEWGTYFKLEVLGANAPVWSWEGPWYAAYRNDFPIVEFTEPLVLSAQDTIRTTCTWFNTESYPLALPQEMCVTFFPFFPGDGRMVSCDESGRVSSR